MSTARERLALEFPDESPYNEELWDFEIFWRDHYDWLKDRGYLLRPRYRPGWVASWIGTTTEAPRCEDNLVQPLFPLNLDAIRVADGKPVMLRRADPPSISDEVEIGRLLSSKESLSDHRNHCVPVYESIELPNANEEGRRCIVVMPLLVPWEEVEFETVGEVVDFCGQIFEGLQFMHKMNVAHNDAKANNIMMDWSPLYPTPPHALRTSMRMDWKGPSKPRNRTLCPIKYHFIDWDLSKQYDTRGVTLRMPGYGGDQSVPEFRRKEPCNPFAVDVYCLGNVIRQKFIEGDPILYDPPRRNVEFLQELVFDMTHDDPKKRPTMDEVVARFDKIRKGLSWWKLRSRVSDKTIPFIFHLLYSPIHWSIQLTYILRRIPAVPDYTTHGEHSGV
ncbi:kinase-like domain-containing protein [Lentinula edodes]|nr:kinase-like domain-containing protein [Lentinula edodes]